MRLSNPEIKALVSEYYPYLEDNDIELFLTITEYQIFNKKEIILKSGRIERTIFLILKGSARAYQINKGGTELNNHLRSDGLFFGDPRVMGDEPQLLDIEAIGEIHILTLNIRKFEALGYENPKIMEFYLNFLKEVILIFSYRINTFVTMSSKERYLDTIKWNPLFLKSTFDKHLASFLGISPLTLLRIKKKTIK